MLQTCSLLLVIASAGAAPQEDAPPDAAPGSNSSLAWVTPPPGELVGVTTPPHFGAADSWRWNLMGAWGFDLADTGNMLGLLGGGFSYFMVENLSLELELNVIYYNQLGPDGVGFNFNLLGRWHFLAKERWSLYAELGAGMQVTTAKVPGPSADYPTGGGYFSFTPQAGVGASFEIAHDTRLLTGVRVQHVSNARTTESNPGRNSLMFYVQVSFPF